MNNTMLTVAFILAVYLFVTILIIIFDPMTQDLRDEIKRIWKK